VTPPVRSYLYVPGDDERKIGKALAGEADAVVLDLEDAVAPNHKEPARATVARVLGSEPGKPVFVRLNAVGTDLFAADIDAVAGGHLAGLRLPKVESVEGVRLVAETLEGLRSGATIQCLIESALGLERAFEIATSHERVSGTSLGEADLAADLGVADEAGLLYARSRGERVHEGPRPRRPAAFHGNGEGARLLRALDHTPLPGTRRERALHPTGARDRRSPGTAGASGG
jgi:citrate lyase subunit beta/citryl-CoA lyase